MNVSLMPKIEVLYKYFPVPGFFVLYIHVPEPKDEVLCEYGTLSNIMELYEYVPYAKV